MSEQVSRVAAVVLGLLSCVTVAAAQSSGQRVDANDNLQTAGVLDGNVMTVNLVAGTGEWYPDGPDFPALAIRAFGEDGRALTAPGPLLRVPSGTDVVVTVRNTIADSPLSIHGLYTRPAITDSVLVVPPGESRTVRFQAGAPGTYFYWAAPPGVPASQRQDVDSQLHGAFVVDEPGAQPHDRIFVLGEMIEPVVVPGTGEILRGNAAGAAGARSSYTINGRGWPLTERLHAVVGEPLEWRWVNPTFGGHPLHLHGHYYTVVASGTLLNDTAYSTEQERLAVTEYVPSGGTMRMRATPERPGNWLFHCHIAGHMSAEARREPASASVGHDHAQEHMAGMVLGIEVTGDGLPIEASLPERRLTMGLDVVPDFFGPARPGIGVSFSEAERVVAPRATPGPPLLLTRGQPVRITIENHLTEPTVIHWHGMELESYFDGVAGFSGSAGSVTPPIPPGGSFEARFTPPRSGTFIYHTHLSDERQLPGGLYGAMVVSDADAAFDPTTDKVALIGLYGSGVAPPNDVIAINGDPGTTFDLRVGVTYRFRLINITANNAAFNVTLASPTGAVEWLAVAKDGAELPSAQRVLIAADRQDVSVGEAYDFEWQPSSAGPYWLEVRRGSGEWMTQAQVTVRP